MKIYGYTIVDTMCFDDGKESLTKVFKTSEERDNEAYAEYVKELEYCLDEDEVEYCPYGDCETDSWEIPDKREFLADLEVGTPHIQRHDTHFQIESWELEL